MTIVDMLDRNASMFADEIALVERSGAEERKEITWKELYERSIRVTHALQTRGIKKGDKVLHLMRNSINWLETYFGVVRTGAWIAPLNYRFDAKDIRYCARISEAKIMIMDSEFIDRVKGIKEDLPTIKDYIVSGGSVPDGWEALEEVIVESTLDYTPVELHSGDEYGLYFTSGTTGAPKPILLSHSNMEIAAITEHAHHFQSKGDNFICIPPLYHAGAKMHWFGSLISGSKATLLKKVSPEIIFQAVHEERGTIVWLLVPWAYDILHAMDSGVLNKNDYDLSCWRLMHIGAQPVPPNLVRRWKQYFPEMYYDTNYGLTEASGPGCVHLGIGNEHKVGAIGQAGLNWQTRIVNEKSEDVTPGQVGELLVKGGGVMKEYYKNPEKTAETLRDGWLYTGDMCMEDEDGFIFLVDRKKDVIIAGGENVYPVEVEDLLHTHPDIYDVAVIGLPDERLGEIVAAVVAIKPGSELTQEQILQFCAERMPRYKRPRIAILADVPRNPTGKIEKPKLREMYCNYPVGHVH